MLAMNPPSLIKIGAKEKGVDASCLGHTNNEEQETPFFIFGGTQAQGSQGASASTFSHEGARVEMARAKAVEEMANGLRNCLFPASLSHFPFVLYYYLLCTIKLSSMFGHEGACVEME